MGRLTGWHNKFVNSGRRSNSCDYNKYMGYQKYRQSEVMSFLKGKGQFFKMYLVIEGTMGMGWFFIFKTHLVVIEGMMGMG